MDLVKYVREKQLKTKLPQIKPGNIVAVHQRIKEGSKERVQIFKGIVIKLKGGYGVDGSFTVRKVASGVGVEKTFLFNSPLVEKIQILKQAKVRRAKLYYLRGRFGKSARLNLIGDEQGTESLIKELVGEEKSEVKETEVVEKEEESEKTEPKAKKEVKSEEKEAKKSDSKTGKKSKKEVDKK